MNKTLILYINGLGRSEKAVGYSKAFQKGLGSYYDHKELAYQSLLEEPLDNYFENAFPKPSKWRWKKRLTWTIRRALFDYAGDEIIYDDIKSKIINRMHNVVSHRDNVIIIAHSLGTIIAADYIKEHGSHNILKLITLGSPLPLFRLGQDVKDIPLLPPGVWSNYIEPNDVIACPINKMNLPGAMRVIDIEFNSRHLFKSWNVSAHNSYFKSKKLIKMIRKDLK